MKWPLMAVVLVLAGCAREPGPGAAISGVDLAQGAMSRAPEAWMTVTVFDRVYYGRYVLAPQLHAVPQNFGGMRSLVRPELELGGQGNARATLADDYGAPLYCLFDVEPMTFKGTGECLDREGRLFDLMVVAAG